MTQGHHLSAGKQLLGQDVLGADGGGEHVAAKLHRQIAVVGQLDEELRLIVHADFVEGQRQVENQPLRRPKGARQLHGEHRIRVIGRRLVQLDRQHIRTLLQGIGRQLDPFDHYRLPDLA